MLLCICVDVFAVGKMQKDAFQLKFHGQFEKIKKLKVRVLRTHPGDDLQESLGF